MSTKGSKREEQLKELQRAIEYAFNDSSLLNTAMTHSSYTANRAEKLEHYERLEFLGDSILSMIVSQYIFRNCKELAEGQLTRVRANIVCEASLYEAAEKIDLGEFLLISKGEELTGGRSRISILADAFEALIAAIYLDGGINKAKSFVLDTLKDIIKRAIQNKIVSDYKSYIQEYIQKTSQAKISYELLLEEGPAHSRTFEIAMMLDDKTIGIGRGNSKKEAQQAAAKNAMEKLEIEYE
ncbi:MAG: ribonuclease III [Lutisporaceae bacterium]